MRLLAHEAYVLTPQEIHQALSSASPNPFSVLTTHGGEFLLWAVGLLIVVVGVFILSLNPFFERICDPFLKKLKRFAPFIGRVTLGSALLASGYYHAIFGPELPISNTLSLVLLLLGSLILIGFLTRFAAIVGVILFFSQVEMHEWYMLTYLNYLAEMLLVTLLGGGKWSLDRHLTGLVRLEESLHNGLQKLEKYSFFILRVGFGVAIFFASFYAKFIHSNLALETVNNYHLTNYFPFTPIFLVCGALLVEAAIGLAFIIGFELRFVALVFISFLTLSILFFGEAVWPHIILFGVNLALFAHGYDQYTLGGLLQGRRYGEPVL